MTGHLRVPMPTWKPLPPWSAAQAIRRAKLQRFEQIKARHDPLPGLGKPWPRRLCHSMPQTTPPAAGGSSC